MKKHHNPLKLNPTKLIIIILLLVTLTEGFPQPSGANLEYITNLTKNTSEGTEISSAGGHIHVMNIQASQQNPYWKAYVGNITGELTLKDSQDHSIFNWPLDAAVGKIFASRHNDINWNQIRCAETSEIQSEDTTLGYDSQKEYSINRTFNNFLHSEFYVFFTLIQENTCPAVRLNTINEENSEDFEEIIITDNNSKIIYSSIINANQTGFNNETYDYQMILPDGEDPQPTTYYFYVELIWTKFKTTPKIIYKSDIFIYIQKWMIIKRGENNWYYLN